MQLEILELSHSLLIALISLKNYFSPEVHSLELTSMQPIMKTLCLRPLKQNLKEGMCVPVVLNDLVNNRKKGKNDSEKQEKSH